MDIINQNPYRVLGVFSNVSSKEIIANASKFRAFARINKASDSLVDFNHLLPPVIRNSETIEKAVSCLSLPQDRLKYALFWFLSSSNEDDCLFSGINNGQVEESIKKYKSISPKETCLTSLHHNCRLFNILKNEKWSNIITDYSLLFLHNKKTLDDFSYRVLGEVFPYNEEELSKFFFDTLITEYPNIDWQKETEFIIMKEEDRNYIKELYINKCTSSIETVIKEFDALILSTKEVFLNNIFYLHNKSLPSLKKLASIVGYKDTLYQTYMDKIVDGTLNKCVRFFNDNPSLETAKCVKQIIEVIGDMSDMEMTKLRAKRNYQVLTKMIDDAECNLNAYDYTHTRRKVNILNEKPPFKELFIRFVTKDLPKYIILLSILYLYFMLCCYTALHWTIKLGCIIPTTFIFGFLAKFIPPENFDGPIEITGKYEGNGFQTWNGIGIDVLGHFGDSTHPAFKSNPLESDEGTPHRSYEFIMLWLPIIPTSCISVSQGTSQTTNGFGMRQNTKTSYRIYGTCKWSILEVVYLYLRSICILAVVIDAIALLDYFF